MKALSISQPWAWIILNCGKRIENRKWKTKIRGEFLIHAPIKFAKYAQQWVADHISKDLADSIPKEKDLPTGGIVGIANLVEVIPPNCGAFMYPEGVDRRWHMVEQCGFVLDNVREVPFRSCKGALNFFEPQFPHSRSVQRRIAAQKGEPLPEFPSGGGLRPLGGR